MLRERLARSKTLTYLDFGEELVTEDGKELRKQYGRRAKKNILFTNFFV